MRSMRELVPVLSCREAVAFEEKLLTSDDAVWSAMRAAGSALGRSIRRDFRWWKEWPAKPRILLLVGKGNNGGDAMIAAAELAARHPALEVILVPVYGERVFKVLPRQAYTQLTSRLGGRLRLAEPREALFAATAKNPFDLTIDGILGAQFSPPVRAPGDAVLEWCRTYRDGLGFRVAVDLPSGMGDECAEDCFAADVTYATGVVKRPVLARDAAVWTGRLRFLDLGFFDGESENEPEEGLVRREVLSRIGRLRPADSDKRNYGQVFLVGGSPRYPGAILMAAQSAVRAGAGLVTAMVVNPLSTHLAAGAPEVMWSTLPTGSDGGLSGECAAAVVEAAGERGVLLIGPGLLPEAGAIDFVSRLLRECPLPMVLDAGALYPKTIAAAMERSKTAGPIVLTPHMGEFKRIGGGFGGDASVLKEELKAFSAHHNVTTVLKGPVTLVSDGCRVGYAPAGNPVLARGGSGDILGGLLVARLAMRPDNAFGAAIEAVMWHGEAADQLARARGETAVRTTGLLEFLAPALRTED